MEKQLASTALIARTTVGTRLLASALIAVVSLAVLAPPSLSTTVDRENPELMYKLAIQHFLEGRSSTAFVEAEAISHFADRFKDAVELQNLILRNVYYEAAEKNSRWNKHDSRETCNGRDLAKMAYTQYSKGNETAADIYFQKAATERDHIYNDTRADNEKTGFLVRYLRAVYKKNQAAACRKLQFLVKHEHSYIPEQE